MYNATDCEQCYYLWQGETCPGYKQIEGAGTQCANFLLIEKGDN